MLLTSTTLALAKDLNDNGSGSDTIPSDALGYFKYDPSMSAEGIRCSLYIKGVYQNGKTFNILNKDIADSDHCLKLGNMPKTHTNGVGNSDWEYKRDNSFRGLTTDTKARIDYLQNDHSIATYSKAFGVEEKVIRNGECEILIEPLAQIRVGDPTKTIIGTPTEIAMYIMDNVDYLKHMNRIYICPNVTAKQWDNKMKQESPSLFHRRLPSCLYLTKPMLGMNAGRAGVYSSDSIKSPSFGAGAFILYKGNAITCPYQWHEGLPEHGTPEAKDPNHPTLPDGSINPPCVCPDKEPEEEPTNTIPEDYINYPFKSDIFTAKGRGEYAGSYGSSGLITGGTSQQYNEIGEYIAYYDFLGDRGYTSDPTHLMISKNQITSVPSILSNVNNVTAEHEGEHEIDKDGYAVVFFPTISTEWERKVRDEDGDYDIVTTTKRVTPPNKVYSAEPTFFGTSLNTKDIKKKEYLYSKGSKTQIVLPIDSSQVFNITPQYKMKFFDGVNSSPQDVWMLASGKRTFTTQPYIVITATHPDLSVLSPWSRDYVDLDDIINTTKAGNAIKAKITEPIKYNIKLTYFLKDPFFRDGSTVNFSTNNSYSEAVEYIAKEISNIHLATNIPYTGDHPELRKNNLGLPPPAASIAKKSIVDDFPEVNKTVYPQKVTAIRSNFDGDKDSLTKTTFNGRSIGLGGVDEISPLIIGGEGKGGWYNEDYEGIIKVVISQDVSVMPDPNTWVEIYRAISDWQSENNTIDNPIAAWGKTIYSGPNFLIGYGSFVPDNKFGNVNIPDIPVYTDLYQFKIRGSAYDQH